MGRCDGEQVKFHRNAMSKFNFHCISNVNLIQISVVVDDMVCVCVHVHSPQAVVGTLTVNSKIPLNFIHDCHIAVERASSVECTI